jgi:hypothetical protein
MLGAFEFQLCFKLGHVSGALGIFRDLGVPSRLVRLVEGESLLNDAAAIVLFTVLLGILADGIQPSFLRNSAEVAVSFGGGIVLGFFGGHLFGIFAPVLGGSKPAEVTLSLALPYIMYLSGECLFGVSGVVAVAVSGLTAGAVGRGRLLPENWEYLHQVWEQIGFWSGSLIFIMASLFVPRMLATVHVYDFWLLVLVVLGAFISRAAVLFVVLPVLSALRLSQPIDVAYQLAVTWGGLPWGRHVGSGACGDGKSAHRRLNSEFGCGAGNRFCAVHLVDKRANSATDHAATAARPPYPSQSGAARQSHRVGACRNLRCNRGDISRV